MLNKPSASRLKVLQNELLISQAVLKLKVSYRHRAYFVALSLQPSDTILDEYIGKVALPFDTIKSLLIEELR